MAPEEIGFFWRHNHMSRALYPFPPPEREKYDRTVASIRAALGEEAFTSAWARGRGLSMEDAVEQALRDPE